MLFYRKNKKYGQWGIFVSYSEWYWTMASTTIDSQNDMSPHRNLNIIYRCQDQGVEASGGLSGTCFIFLAISVQVMGRNSVIS